MRKLLRHGGYKPTGRGKPASEYLVRAAGEGEGFFIMELFDRNDKFAASSPDPAIFGKTKTLSIYHCSFNPYHPCT